jgi:hypothetical protein
MLGFKLEVPQREDSVKGKTRPIYLDMQVGTVPRVSSIPFIPLVRPLLLLTLAFWMLCFRTSQINMAIPIVGLMHTVGRPSKRLKMLV